MKAHDITHFIMEYGMEQREDGTWKGFTMESWDEVEAFIPEGFEEVTKWADGNYRKVYVNREDLAIISYAEGDLYVNLYETKEAFDQALEESGQFYSQTA